MEFLVAAIVLGVIAMFLSGVLAYSYVLEAREQTARNSTDDASTCRAAKTVNLRKEHAK